MTRTLRFLFFGLLLAAPLGAATTLSVDAGTVVNSFVPYNAFGANCVSWADPRPVAAQIQAAGNFIERFPGGSWADTYHWNGTGSYAADGTWVPSSTTASTGSMAKTVTYAPANVTDNNTATVWQSNADTDYPNSQWLYLSLGSQQSVDSVKITWGTVANAALPYAARFTVQTWSPSNGQQWLVYSAPSSGWANTSAVDWSGNGGAQTVTFTAVTTGFVRVLMTQSSAGAGGAYSVAELHVYSGATEAPLASWDPVNASSMDPASVGGGWVAYSFDQFMAMLNAMTPKGQPLITVNMGTGTPQEAAAWVYYANVVKGYGIKDWEIGNEMGGDWESGGPLNAADYGRRYVEFVQAMKAVDPTIVCIGGAGAGFSSNSELYDGNGYIKGFVDRLAADPGGNKAALAQGIVIHDYPGQGQTPAQKLAGLSTEMGGVAPSLAAQLANHPQASTVPIWITEYNSWCSNDANDITVRLDNALFVAGYLGEFLKQFGSRGYTQLWATLNGGSAATSTTGGDLGYLDNSGAPRADYWAMQMMAADWSTLGDTQTHQLVSSGSSQAFIKTYADLRPDGDLSLLVDNTDPSNSYPCTVNLSNYLPAAQADEWSLSAANYVWETSSTPYHASVNTGPSYVTITGVSSSFAFTVPAYALCVLRFHPGGTPTPSPSPSPYAGTPTATPTPSPTPSPTVTLTPACGGLVDGFESLNDNGNWSGGLAQRSIVAAGTAPAGAVTQGGNCMLVNVTSSAAYNNDILRLTGFSPGNLAAYTQLKLDVYMPAGMVDTGYNQLQMVADCAACPNGAGTGIWYQSISDAPNFAGGAQTLTYNINFAAGGLPLTATVSSLDFILNQGAGHSGGFYVDNLRLVGPCGLASPTPTVSGSPSASLTPSPSASPTASPTVSPTASPTPSLTDTSSASPSASATPTASASSTPAYSPTASPTETPYAGTPTVSPSLSPSPSASPTTTPTGTPSATATVTASATGSPTPTASPSGTPSNTESPTPSVSATASPSVTPGATASPSVTPGATASPTVTPSGTASPTVTPSGTASATASPTAMASPSDTPGATASPTATASGTPGATASVTPTDTMTPSAVTVDPTPSNGILSVDQVEAWPNPQGGDLLTLKVKLRGPAETLDLRLYTQALVRVAGGTVGGGEGWVTASLPLPPLPSGVYFVQVSACRGVQRSRAVLAKLLRLN